MEAQAILTIISALVTYGPKVAFEIADVFRKNDIKINDWQTVLAPGLSKSVDDYLAEAKRKAGQ